MNVFSLLSLFGGLAMFLYGMRLMSDTIKESSSGALKILLERVTNSTLKAFLLGVIVTAIIQSSKATIVITAGLVAAGILTFKQSIGIVVGANVGTTITGQIIRLLDLDGTSGSILQLLQPSTLAPLSFIIGIIMIMFLKTEKSKTLGNVLMGFGILFTGLLNMTGAVSSISDEPLVINLFSSLGNNVVLAYITGAVVAFILQSSSATIGILQAFAGSGVLTFKGICATILGIYVGDCVTTAVVTFANENKEARKVGVFNLLYNASKSIVVIIGLLILSYTRVLNNLYTAQVTSSIIANTNTIFNLASAMLIFPLFSMLEKIANSLISEDNQSIHKYQEKVDALNPAFFSTPALALRSCYDVLTIMFEESRDNIERSLKLLESYDENKVKEINKVEDEIDYLKDQLSAYITKLLPHLKEEYHISIINQYHRINSEFEHLGDVATFISVIAKTFEDEKINLSDAAIEELDILYKLINNILDDTKLAFEKRDYEAAKRIEPQSKVSDEIINLLKTKHLERMAKGECDVLIDTHYMNLLANLKDITDICSNVGIATILRVKPELTSQRHDYTNRLHDDKDYNQVYDETYHNYIKELEEL